MKANEIYDKLKEEFGDEIIDLVEDEISDPFINVKPDKIDDICLFLRDGEGIDFDYLTMISGMDLGDAIGVVYHLYSLEYKHSIVLKLQVPKGNPDVPTVEKIWRTADWHEREAWDMFGVNFVGHHNLIRILCPYDWEGFPLRRDYKEPEEYHGMKVPY